MFAHQLINTNRFGRLILSADGNIYTSLNSEPVGTIESDIFSLVDEQLKKGSAWRSIRNNDICEKCLFQWLCPSPSEYNEVLDQPNMCDLRSLSMAVFKYTNDLITLSLAQAIESPWLWPTERTSLMAMLCL
jgi:hypothetical protein